MIYVGFEILTVVVLNDSIFWDLAFCNQYMNRNFGGIYDLQEPYKTPVGRR
jgi:hypothetical protein